jgi:hypothetical protein
MHLKERWFAEITLDEARWLTGPDFVCPKGKKPYIIRATYGSPSGAYTVTRSGNKLLALHISLGNRGRISKSALIVNLDFHLEDTYAGVSFTL